MQRMLGLEAEAEHVWNVLAFWFQQEVRDMHKSVLSEQSFKDFEANSSCSIAEIVTRARLARSVQACKSVRSRSVRGASPAHPPCPPAG